MVLHAAESLFTRKTTFQGLFARATTVQASLGTLFLTTMDTMQVRLDVHHLALFTPE